MKDSKKDIENFDRLQEGEGLSDELLAIQNVDEFLSESKPTGLSSNFTSMVISSAVAHKRKKSRFGFFGILFGIMFAILAVLWASLSPNEASAQSPEYLPLIMNHVESLLNVFSDPKVKQLLIIVEAIILLLLVDQIFNRFRNISTSAH